MGHIISSLPVIRGRSSMDQLALPWIAAALVAITALWLLFQDTPCLLDVALIFSTILVLVLIWSNQEGSELLQHRFEAFMNPPPSQVEDGVWQKGLAANGHLVTYVSAFRTDSSSNTTVSSIWQSVAEAIMGTDKGLGSDDSVFAASVAAAEAAATAGIVCQPPSAANKDFTFSSPPVSSGFGFALANSSLTGPMSMVLLPPTLREYTAFCLFQLTGLPAAGTTVSLLNIPANGNNAQNGLTLTLTGAGSGSSVTAAVAVTVGAGNPLPCGDGNKAPYTVAFDTGAIYLLSITRQSTHIRVSLFNVESSSLQCKPNTILDQAVPDDALLYNNQHVMINADKAILGNILTFGMFDMALVTQDEALICSHYQALLLQKTPAMQLALSTAASATQLLACPYDAVTCDACSSVTSWANMFNIADGGSACLKAIDTFCTENPTHASCDCYNPATVATFSVATRDACLALRSAYSGSTTSLCAVPVQQALAAAQTSNNAVAAALAAANMEEEEMLLSQIVRQEAARASHPPEPEPARQSFFAWLFGLFGL